MKTSCLIILFVMSISLAAQKTRFEKTVKRFEAIGIPEEKLNYLADDFFYTSPNRNDSFPFFRIYNNRAKLLVDSVTACPLKEYNGLIRGSNGYAFEKKGKYGYAASPDYRPVNFVPPVFDSLNNHAFYPANTELCNGEVLVQKNGLWGIYYHSRQVAPCIYDSIRGICGNQGAMLFIVFRKGKSGFLSCHGKTILETACTSLEYSRRGILWGEDIVAGEINGKYRVANVRNGRHAGHEYVFVDCDQFFETSFVAAWRNGGWTLLNKRCRECVKPVYKKPEDAYEAMCSKRSKHPMNPRYHE